MVYDGMVDEADAIGMLAAMKSLATDLSPDEPGVLIVDNRKAKGFPDRSAEGPLGLFTGLEQQLGAEAIEVDGDVFFARVVPVEGARCSRFRGCARPRHRARPASRRSSPRSAGWRSGPRPHPAPRRAGGERSPSCCSGWRASTSPASSSRPTPSATLRRGGLLRRLRGGGSVFAAAAPSPPGDRLVTIGAGPSRRPPRGFWARGRGNRAAPRAPSG